MLKPFLKLSTCLVVFSFSPLISDAHRSGCHRWHSCPSDRGTYTCGDIGYCSQCLDNQYCEAGKPRVTKSPPSAENSKVEASVQFKGKVVGITDGDTIEVMHLGKAEKIRLAGIDCPEKKQAFGTRAKQFTSDMVFGKVVNVNVETVDRYGRTIGEVFLTNGKNLNRELVKAGFAWWYQKYSNDETLGKLEEEARRTKRGLWVDPHPIPPWEFRKGR